MTRLVAFPGVPTIKGFVTLATGVRPITSVETIVNAQLVASSEPLATSSDKFREW